MEKFGKVYVGVQRALQRGPEPVQTRHLRVRLELRAAAHWTRFRSEPQPRIFAKARFLTILEFYEKFNFQKNAEETDSTTIRIV